MVQFGRRLLESDQSYYRNHFLNYKLLKSRIHELSDQRVLTIQDVTSIVHSDLIDLRGLLDIDKVELLFRNMLAEEVTKVESFIQVELHTIMSMLNRSIIGGDKSCVSDVVQLTLGLDKFIQTNITGFRKITKKFDKKLGRNFAKYFMADLKSNSLLFSCDFVDAVTSLQELSAARSSVNITNLNFQVNVCRSYVVSEEDHMLVILSMIQNTEIVFSSYGHESIANSPVMFNDTDSFSIGLTLYTGMGHFQESLTVSNLDSFSDSNMTCKLICGFDNNAFYEVLTNFILPGGVLDATTILNVYNEREVGAWAHSLRGRTGVQYIHNFDTNQFLRDLCRKSEVKSKKNDKLKFQSNIDVLSLVHSTPMSLHSTGAATLTEPHMMTSDVRSKSFSQFLWKLFTSNKSMFRKEIIRVEPKSFFSNERNLLDWLHVSILLITTSTLTGEASLKYILSTVSILFCFMSYILYKWRISTMTSNMKSISLETGALPVILASIICSVLFYNCILG